MKFAIRFVKINVISFNFLFGGLLLAGSRAWLQVTFVEKLPEEIQIGNVHDGSEAENFPAAGAVWHRIRCLDVHELDVDVAKDDELHDLDGCDELGHVPRGANFQSLDSKVEIHDGVDRKI